MSRFNWIRRLFASQGTAAGRRPVSLRLLPLEDRLTPAAPFPEFVDPNPDPTNLPGDNNNNFGQHVVALSTGNVVITSPFDDAGGEDAGAVYLFNGATGALISTLRGSSPGNQIGSGGVVALTNGNYVISSPDWDTGGIFNVGAVTIGNGVTGIGGVVSAANSLVGSSNNDTVGSSGNGGGVIALPNGNYVVASQSWNNGAVVDAGAVTFGSGTTGVVGVVSAANSLVGSTANDRVGRGTGQSVIPLTNGNYVVSSSFWDNGAAVDAGAVTFGNGTTGVAGVITAANSLVGSTTGDQVGEPRFRGVGVLALTNGNYVVASSFWDNGAAVDAGAVTFGNGTTGVAGVITAANSLVGDSTDDEVGNRGPVALANGNYVVRSSFWDDGAVVDVGAVTFGNGTTGVVGVVSAANSLVGSTANDRIGSGGLTALTNGNYVVSSASWDNGAVQNVGAVTLGNGTAGTVGVVSAANSLVGSVAFDLVGNFGVVALANGNYVVRSADWNNGPVTNVGAVTLGNGTAGTVGVVSAANSLVGTTADDQVGYDGVTSLTNGNYVVLSAKWDNGAVVDAGAATFGNGTTGVVGVVSAANSLVGSTKDDRVGLAGVTPLTNGNYLVSIPEWDNGGVVNAGAVTFGNGTTGVVGVITPANSLVGTSKDDSVGGLSFSSISSVPRDVMALPNGNYYVTTPLWDNGPLENVGAVTFGNGTTGVVGPISTQNSAVGLTAFTGLVSPAVGNLDNVNGTFFGRFITEGSGRVRVGSQVDGFAASPPPPITNETHTISPIPDQSSTGGVIGPIPVTVTDDDNFTGEDFTFSVQSSEPDIIPVENIVISGTGLNRTITITPVPGRFGQAEITLLVNDNVQLVATETFRVTVTKPVLTPPVIGPGLIPPILIRPPVSPPVSPPPVALPSLPSPVVPPSSRVFLRAVGVGVGGEPRVRVLNADGSERFDILAYDPAFRGGVSVTTADVTGDGVDDLITAAGAGGGPHVKVFDGVTGAEVFSFFAYDPAFTGGVSVAAGDVNGDGFADIVTGAGAGGGPHVRVFDGRTGGELASFFAYHVGFTGGVSVAVGDVNGDGRADVVTGAGSGGGPHVKVVNATALGQTNADGTIADTALLANFMAFDLAFGGGVNVSAGDFNGDGLADVVVGAGAGGGPHVKVVSATGLSRTNADGGIADAALLANFFGYEEGFAGGVRVGVADGLPGGGSGLILGAGPGGGPRMRVLRADGLAVVEDFFAYAPEFTGGVFVG